MPACDRPPVVVTAASTAAMASTRKINFRMISSSLLAAQEENAHAYSKFSNSLARIMHHATQ